MRGSNSLFADIFDQPADPAVVKHRKGRSAELNILRNELLVARYFFYCQFSDVRYSKVIEKLSTEFFLSPVTIPEVLNDNSEQLKELAKSKPLKSYFSKKWPHMVW